MQLIVLHSGDILREKNTRFSEKCLSSFYMVSVLTELIQAFSRDKQNCR